MKTLSFNDNLLTIERYAFNGCSGIATARIGSQITEIGDGAFKECLSLTKVTIHARNVSIGSSNAFDKGTQLTLRGYENSTTQKYAASNNNRFEKIVTTKLNTSGFSLKTTSYLDRRIFLSGGRQYQRSDPKRGLQSWLWLQQQRRDTHDRSLRDQWLYGQCLSKIHRYEICPDADRFWYYKEDWCNKFL